MSYRYPSEPYERFARLLRNGLDPWVPAHRREAALRTLGSYTPERLEMLFRDLALKDVLGALDAPYSVPEPSEGATSSRTGPTYGLAADLRRLLNAAFTSPWYRIDPDIEKAVRASDRALICAAAVAGESRSDEDLARGAAWTQMVPGAALLAIQQQWPAAPGPATAYLQHTIDRGASQASLPPLFALAIVDELASRPAIRDWYDGITDWLESWLACAPIEEGAGSGHHQFRRTLLWMRVQFAMRARAMQIRSPRLLALLELTIAVAVVRAAGRADLLRAYVEAAGDPVETARAHAGHDRRADLLVETVFGEILRQPDSSAIGALPSEEREALAFVDDILSRDSGLVGGLLSTESGCDE